LPVAEKLAEHLTRLPAAVAAASRNPLALLGISDRGRIATGQRADLVELAITKGLGGVTGPLGLPRLTISVPAIGEPLTVASAATPIAATFTMMCDALTGASESPRQPQAVPGERTNSFHAANPSAP